MTDRRDVLVEVAARLLHAEGVDAVTTRRVAQEAGVQAPAIYRVFGDKDGLLDAVAEHTMATWVADKTRRAAGARDSDPVSDVRAGWIEAVEFGLANPALVSLMMAPRPGAPSPAVAAGLEVLRAKVRRLAEHGRLALPQEQATTLLHASGNGLVVDLLSRPVEERDLGMVEVMCEAVLAAVVTPDPGDDRPDPGPVPAALALLAHLDGLDLTPAERGLMREWLDRTTRA
ncbi:TetR/AcrR family transcriptional regulator [Nocardioides KLBMP 9356]|uniref:TetR/AcrR family transcriptional regulator n=1 Tax=Nocardioides potassii TaxID=2911371 RepID=A0ABS9H9X1_9ACTN|nr:TetR/AcrR family transcriptional regulator [Nocardioides potassii]MCF6378017.1 TetR/AcrR family transcriptional regulator [Nocardioides potassii]